jgi:allophanate hydrolase
VFEGQHRLEALRRRAHAALATVDFLIVPTTPTIYRIEEIEAEPRKLNAQLGAYANFVNLLDLAAIAVPAGFRPNGLPAGVTLVGLPGRDADLGGYASALHRSTSTALGATGLPFPAPPTIPTTPPDDKIPLAVVGAHLAGEPLNHQLTGAGGVFVRAARTAPAYRLHALPGTSPPKPGLVRAAAEGTAIEVEVWALPPAAFGAFVARVPPPLCIGSVELEDGSRVSGFLCEGHAIAGAPDISTHGGWRAYLRHLEP